MQKIARFEAESEKVLNVGNFLMYYNLVPRDIYRKSSSGAMCGSEPMRSSYPRRGENLTIAAKRFFPLNSVSLIRFIRQYSQRKNSIFRNEYPQLESSSCMLYYSFHLRPLTDTIYHDLSTSMESFLKKEWIASELDSLLVYLEDKTEVLEGPLDLGIPTSSIPSLHVFTRSNLCWSLHWTPHK